MYSRVCNKLWGKNESGQDVIYNENATFPKLRSK